MANKIYNPIEQFGYEAKTTFWMDFSIADRFGVDGVKDTYKRAMDSWKNDYIYLTELYMVLNHKIWQHYQKNEALYDAYMELFDKCGEYAMEHLKGEELSYFYTVTD